ncbi:MAG: xanthine phosphoribosyltransferase [Clostridia bacterium]|nr:xanthine phosphoribosyltransferase [Clostridia bacterium]
MKALEEKILNEGTVLSSDILKVGSFLNQQIDIDFLLSMGEEIDRIYKGEAITKILTIEASGIAVAVAAAAFIRKNVVFAKKIKTSNVSGEVYSAKVHSFTHGTDNLITVPKDYICAGDKVLIIDDFLANGEALRGLIDIVEQAGAEVVGCTCAIEKGFQGGGDALRKQGYRIESLAVIEKMAPEDIVFRN